MRRTRIGAPKRDESRLGTPCGWMAALLLVLAGGCVHDGEMDPTLVTRYQEAVAARSPLKRQSTGGLDMLRPATAAAVPLQVAQDPQTRAAVVNLSLDDAVRLALLNSLDIQVASFDPAISREDAEKAAAAFDWEVFGSVTHSKINERSATVGAAENTRSVPIKLGLRDKLTTGGQVEATYETARTSDDSAFAAINPRWDSRLSLKVVQPLLRGAGSDYNLSTLKVARLNQRIAMAQFRQAVEQTVAKVMTAYWSLVQARQDVAIQERLLAKTMETADRVIKRRDVDATAVEVKQSEAAVETRRATLVRARKNILDAQEQLARLLNDRRMNLLGRYSMVPTTPAVASEYKVDPTDVLASALQYSAVLEQARAAAAAQQINVGVARNEALPMLNLIASTAIQGLDRRWGTSNEDMFSTDFFSHTVGAEFEWPFGNRAAQAALRQQLYRHRKSLAELQNAADQIAVAVNEALRQIETTWEEVKAFRLAEEAARIQLQALEDTEQVRGRLTPEFLQLKLQAQEALAQTERSELQAVINYNNALAQLAQVSGTTLQQHNIRLATEMATDQPPVPVQDALLPPANSPPTMPATTRAAATATAPAR